ncbi:hypothetical protein ABPG74_016641 [Tetrahymena malaccensis]
MSKQSQENQQTDLVLGYWPFAGRNMPVIFMLEILNIPYQVNIFDQNTWFGKEKEDLNLDFPNLPFLIDNSNGTKITEIHNIVNYILYKYEKGRNLQDIHRQSPNSLNRNRAKLSVDHSSYNPIDDFKIDEIRFILNDVFTQISSATAKFPQENQIKYAQDTIVPKLNKLIKFIEQKNQATTSYTQYFVMGYLSVVDCYFYIISKYFQKYFPSLYDDYSHVFDLVLNSFESIPEIKKYINSDKYPALG